MLENIGVNILQDLLKRAQTMAKPLTPKIYLLLLKLEYHHVAQLLQRESKEGRRGAKDAN
jgi:hypothetical protein